MPKHGNKLYGARDISRHCNQMQKDGRRYDGKGSIADKAHAGSRAEARARRQREARERKLTPASA